MTRRPPAGVAATPPEDVLARMTEAEDTLRAISAGEIDAFVLSDGDPERRVFTLSTADRPYRMFVENMRDGAATLSADGLILYANQRLADLLAAKRDTLVGMHLSAFVETAVPDALLGSRVQGETEGDIELVLRGATGLAVPVLAGVSPLDVDGDRLTCVTFTDMSALKARDGEIARLMGVQAERLEELQSAQDALTEQATHDALTGLPNRVLLVDRIGQALAQATRTNACTVILFLDLDRFKHVNDTRGHAAGDEELKRVAEWLVAELRPMDTVARLGGDEFVILAPRVERHLDGVDMGLRLVDALSRRPERADGGEPIAVSVGISISVGGVGTPEALLHEADTAMYHAKSRGGGRAEVFDEALGAEVHERAKAQRTVQWALDEHRIAAWYQPIIDLASGEVVSFEALARVIDIDGVAVPPAAFIPAAEASGLVAPLGARMLELACGQAQRWNAALSPAQSLAVAVNLSARQFDGGNLPRIVEEALRASGMNAASLHLELTETAIIDLRPDVLHQLGQIRELGVQIGLDDFGTGYASLTHLRRLPLTFVKIDQSFVQGIGVDVGDERIVGSVVDLASNLGLRSIAEGVETAEQLTALREMGADQAQGYFIGRPLPAHEIRVLAQRTR